MDKLLVKLKSLSLSYISQRPGIEESQKALWSSWLQDKIEGGPPLATDKGCFHIGNVKIENPVISAPLAGISDNSYRIFASMFGCGLTFSEMVTSYGLCYNHKKSMRLAAVIDMERPCAVQIFGSEPSIMAQAAQKIAPIADIVDINMGCPVPKVLKGKSGGWLMQDPKAAEKIIRAAVNASKVPVTVKTRLGWDSSSINVAEFAEMAQEAGASALSIHGRTVKQGFSGQADYSFIKKVKEKSGIPIIASGDINSVTKAKEVLKYTGCDAIMIGRSSKGRSWLFADILLGLSSMGESYEPLLDWVKEYSLCYLDFMVYFKGEQKAVREFRKFLSWIFKGIRGISKLKQQFFTIKDYKDAAALIDGM